MSREKEKFVMRLAFRRGQDFADRSQTPSEPKSLPNRIYRPLTWPPRSGQSKVGNTKLREIINAFNYEYTSFLLINSFTNRTLVFS
jgi:hypothetical protein